MPEAKPPSSPKPAIAILAIALVLRLLVLWSVAAKYPALPFYTKGVEMGFLAKSLLLGQGLASPFGTPTGLTAFIAPGYPIFVAGVFRIFGVYSLASELVIIAIQIAANVLTVWLIMHIARSLFGRASAIIAGLIWACSPPLIFMPTIFWDTSIAICLFTGFIALVLRIRPNPTRPAWLFLGAYAAVTSLINPALLFALAAVLIWLAFETRAHSRANILFAALAFCTLFSPWPLRNARAFHAFVPLRTTVGFELWMGNHPNASGYLEENLFPMYNAQELADYKRLGEIRYTTQKTALAKQFIFDHPATFARLTVVRITRYWLGTGNRNGSPFFGWYATFTSAFGLCGLWFLFRSRRHAIALLFALPLLLFPLPYYITHAEFRYRLALDPLLTLLAAHALAYFYRRATLAAQSPKPAAIEALHA